MRFSKLVAILCIALVVGGSIFAILSAREPYPFSDYPMYSRSFNPEVYTYLELVGIREDGSEWKIPVARLYRPLTEAALVEAISVHHRWGTGKNPQIVQDLYSQYERRKQRFMPEAPTLKGFRLYRTKFDWPHFKEEKLNAPPGAPYNPPPQEREMLYEVLG